MVDDKDYERVSLYKWSLYKSNKGGYMITSTIEPCASLANYIINDYKNMYDHKDRNILNNTRANLRIANSSQNTCNQAKRKGNCSSKYKGVTKHRSKWRAMICHDRIQHSLGCYSNEIEAAKAYDRAAIKYHKEFAVTNFPREDYLYSTNS